MATFIVGIVVGIGISILTAMIIFCMKEDKKKVNKWNQDVDNSLERYR